MITTSTDEYVTVLPNGVLEVKIVTNYVEDGTPLTSKNWRTTYAPTTDISTMTGRAAEIATLMWTPELIDAYVASLPEPLTGENNV